MLVYQLILGGSSKNYLLCGKWVIIQCNRVEDSNGKNRQESQLITLISGILMSFYVIYNTQVRLKMDQKSKRCIFLGYIDGVKGYYLWNLNAHKIVISRDIMFVEDQMQKRDIDDSTIKIQRLC